MNHASITLRQQMFGLVEQWHQSEVGKKEFCEQHGISQWKLFYWQEKYNRKQNPEKPGKFIPVETSSEKNNAIVIFYPNGIRVEVPTETDFRILKGLIR